MGGAGTRHLARRVVVRVEARRTASGVMPARQRHGAQGAGGGGGTAAGEGGRAFPMRRIAAFALCCWLNREGGLTTAPLEPFEDVQGGMMEPWGAGGERTRYRKGGWERSVNCAESRRAEMAECRGRQRAAEGRGGRGGGAAEGFPRAFEHSGCLLVDGRKLEVTIYPLVREGVRNAGGGGGGNTDIGQSQKKTTLSRPLMACHPEKKQGDGSRERFEVGTRGGTRGGGRAGEKGGGPG